ncbi:hypothetical protein HH308_20200 [Gordonia sp. TBRC 11910]|uniref:PucR C-terminal helix-turn-helix domain-containing protein n=1 Tax=Gordonia asplenii TaxID=2725283 RepID=A0A848KZA7_9ACTN|nr:helix-turn-helix domain-containing protein [Gordonia asplenii]NMO03542.1 hypothetical protein [Gordonia asplenii]
MRELIIKLNTLDGGAADALRVIEHFDALVDSRSSALAMLRAAAVLAECPIGLEDPDRGLRVGVDAAGRTVADPGESTASREVARFEEITVWLDRDGPSWPLDHLILERFARSLHAVKKTRDVSPAVAATRTLCERDATPADRAAALCQLGLGSTVTVVVTHVADAPKMPPGLIVDEYQITLFPASAAGAPVPRAIAAGLHTCAGVDVHHEWRHACTALRIAIDLVTGKPTHVNYDELGSIATVVDSVDADLASSAPDVCRVVELQAERSWVVPTMEALLSHCSIREVARTQNLHHSTMRQRIDWLERKLGYTFLSTDGYARASTTLTLWRIAMAAENAQQPYAASALLPIP